MLSLAPRIFSEHRHPGRSFLLSSTEQHYQGGSVTGIRANWNMNVKGAFSAELWPGRFSCTLIFSEDVYLQVVNVHIPTQWAIGDKYRLIHKIKEHIALDGAAHTFLPEI